MAERMSDDEICKAMAETVDELSAICEAETKAALDAAGETVFLEISSQRPRLIARLNELNSILVSRYLK